MCRIGPITWWATNPYYVRPCVAMGAASDKGHVGRSQKLQTDHQRWYDGANNKCPAPMSYRKNTNITHLLITLLYFI